MIKKTIFACVLLFMLLQPRALQSQQNSYSANRYAGEKLYYYDSVLHRSWSYKQMLIPASLIAYGILSVKK